MAKKTSLKIYIFEPLKIVFKFYKIAHIYQHFNFFKKKLIMILNTITLHIKAQQLLTLLGKLRNNPNNFKSKHIIKKFKWS